METENTKDLLWANSGPSEHHRLSFKLFAVLVFSYPILALLVKGAMNATFSLTVLVAIYFLVKEHKHGGIRVDRQEWGYLIAMGLLPVAILLSEIRHWDFLAPPYDAASRFLLSGLLFIALRRAKIQTLESASIGFALGTFSAAAAALWLSGAPGPRADTYFLDPIHFGDTALALGVVSGASIDWTSNRGFMIKAIKVIGLLLGVYLSIRSGSRGGWVAMPVILLAWVYFQSNKMSAHQWVGLAVIGLVSGIGLYMLDHEVQRRINDVWQNLARYRAGHFNTAVGIRFKLWQAALTLWFHNLFFGIGPRGLKLMMVPMSEFGMTAPIIAEAGRAEMHNDILSNATALGLPGLAASLALYIAPASICISGMRSGDARRKRAGLAGVLFVLGFAIFGLTVQVFDLSMITAFYSLTVALLCAAAAGPKKHHDATN